MSLHILPTELLCRVFEFGALDYRRDGQVCFQLLMSHICKTWRRIVISFPPVWATIDASIDPDVMSHERELVFIQRSQSHGLHVHLMIKGGIVPAASEDLLRALAQCSARWHRLLISSDSAEAFGVVSRHFKGLHVPRLQAMQIFAATQHSEMRQPSLLHHDILFDISPKMRFLRAYGINQINSGSTLSDLVQAEFAHVTGPNAIPTCLTAKTLRVLAEAAPRLQHLLIWCQVICDDSVEHPANVLNVQVEHVAFPNLDSLQLNLGGWDGHVVLIAPRLTSLLLSGVRRRAELVDFLTPIVTRKPALRFPSVTTLHLHKFSDNQPGIGRLLAQSFGDVERLHLGDIQTSSLFCALSTAHTDGSMPWRKLQSLAMLYADAEDLLQIARARSKTPLLTIETNLYHGDDMKEYESIPQRNDIFALRKLVDMQPLPKCLEGKMQADDHVHPCLGCDWGSADPMHSGAFPPPWNLTVPNVEDDEDVLDEDQDVDYYGYEDEEDVW